MNNKTAKTLRELTDAEHERDSSEWKSYYKKLKKSYKEWRKN